MWFGNASFKSMAACNAADGVWPAARRGVTSGHEGVTSGASTETASTAAGAVEAEQADARPRNSTARETCACIFRTDILLSVLVDRGLGPRSMIVHKPEE